MTGLLKDAYQRTIRDLRVSLTDRCNFRCFYCRPEIAPPTAGKKTILTFEEIYRLCEIFVSLGIKKIRLTGGEPLLRKDIERLISSLARLKPGLREIALTTNGFSLPTRAEALKAAGLDRVTISLDSLDRGKFRQITGADCLDSVFEAIVSARQAGLEPVKINTVVIKGCNDDEIVRLARFARENSVAVRFIEFMPLDSGKRWRRRLLVSGREIRKKIDRAFPLEPIGKERGSETARRFRFADGAGGEIGIIAPVTDMFCGACSRIRLTADGQLRTCLFSNVEHDLRDVLRRGAGREEISARIRRAVLQKEKSHRINEAGFVQPDRTMSLIGG